MSATWYNAERVAQPGSVVLARWKAERAAQRAQNATTIPASEGTYGTELYEWLVGSASNSPAGVPVTERTAMSVGAVFACVGLISSSIAQMPLHIYKRTEAGQERVDETSNTLAANIWWMFNEQPHPLYSAAVFWEYFVASMLLGGVSGADGFAKIERSGSTPTGLKLYHPDDVQVVEDTKLNALIYLCNDLGFVTPVHQDDMLHVPGVGYSRQRRRGLSVLQNVAKSAVGIALAADEYQARFFGNGARPDFALTTASKLSEDQVQILRDTWQNRFSGVAKSHLPAVLTGGLDVKPLNLSHADQEIIATRQFQVIDIARIFGVPPHMIGETDKTTSWGSGIEQQAIAFVKHTLGRHIVKIKQEINRKIFPRTARWYAEFNPAGLERGDLKTRYEAHRIALGRAGEPGWMKINEIRRLENLPPVADGDTINTGRTDNASTAAPAGQ